MASDFLNILKELRGTGAPGDAYTDGIYYDIVEKATEDDNVTPRLAPGIYASIKVMYDGAGVLIPLSAEIQALSLITDAMSSLYADKATLDSLYADKITLDSLYADKLTLDSLYADKATLDSLFADKAKLDSLFTDKATLDSLYADKIKLDSLYADKATLDLIAADIAKGIGTNQPTDSAILNALTNANVATANAAITSADVLITNADVVTTNADVVLTNADAAQTALDVIATNQDTLDTAADLVATNADVVSSNLSATNAQLSAWEAEAERLTADSYATEAEDVFVNIWTSDGDGTFTSTPTLEYSSLHYEAKATASAAAALVSEGLADADATQTALDVIATNADVLITNADVVSTNADATQTALDVIATNADAIATAADVVTVAGIYDNFDDRYLGSKDVEPTLDNDGALLLEGAIYWNSITKRFRVYDGASWSDAISGLTEGSVSTLTNKTINDISNDVAANVVHMEVESDAQTINPGDVLEATNIVGDTIIKVQRHSSLANPVVGIALDTMGPGVNGRAMITGVYNNYDSTGLSLHTILYGDGAGGLTATPTIANGNYNQPIAYVEKINGANADLVVNVHSAHESADLISYNNAGTSLISNNIQGAVTELAPFVIHDSLLVYYGFPIAFNGAWDTAVAIEAISKYDTWVVGASYEDPLHAEYASTQTIIAGVRANGVKVYGYVATNSAITIGTITTAITNWDTLNVDGIFLDEFGFDYGNTRTRQIDIVNLVTAAGLPYIGNAWVWSEVLCDTAAQLPWAVDDWRYLQFVAGNPTDLALPRTVNDGYLFENYGVSNTATDSMWDLHDRVREAIEFNDIATTKMELHGLAVVGESPAGTPDMTLYTEFPNYDALNRYIISASYIHNLTSIGIGGFSFGSAGNAVPFEMFSIPSDAEAPTAISWDFTNGVFSSYYGKYNVEVVTIGTAYSHSVTSTEGETLVNESIPHITGLQDYTDKLDGIEAGATADQTKADIDALGIDAETLDGLDSTQFLRSDTSDNVAGQLSVTHTGTIGGTPAGIDNAWLLVTDGGTNKLGFDPNELSTTATTLSISTNTVNSPGSANVLIDGGTAWHSANDGAGSGLDADTLDGYHANSGITGSTIPVRDANGDITCRLYKSTFAEQTTTPASTADFCFRNSTTDPYMRFVSQAGLIGYLNAGSGLDADTVDGIEGASILLKPGDHTGNYTEYSMTWENNAGTLYTSSADLTYNPGEKRITAGRFTASLNSVAPHIHITGHGGSAAYSVMLSQTSSSGGAGPVFFFNGATRTADGGANRMTLRNDGGGSRFGSSNHTTSIDGSGNLLHNDLYTIWTSNNDGAGSGLDADLLDGRDGSGYIMTSGGNYDFDIASNVNSSGYAGAAIEVRELNHAGIQTGAASEAPRISFHWGSRVASQIGIGTDGVIRTYDNPGTGYENFACQNVYANGTNYHGNGKIMFGFSDGWLRINDTNAFTAGIYCGTGILRTDGMFQVGSNGASLLVTNAGVVTAASTIQGTQLKSTVATGTAPLTVASTTKVTNLNADLLDGQSLDSNATGNTVVSRSAAGYIYASAFNSALGDTATTPSHVYVETNSDGWMRPQPVATFKTNLGIGTEAGKSWVLKWSGSIYQASINYGDGDYKIKATWPSIGYVYIPKVASNVTFSSCGAWGPFMYYVVSNGSSVTAWSNNTDNSVETNYNVTEVWKWE